MKNDKIIEKIDKYSENDMPFSALSFLKKLTIHESSDFFKFKHAEILRLAGQSRRAISKLSEINIDNVPLEFRYLIHLNKGSLYMDMGYFELGQQEFLKCFEYEECDTVPYILMSNILMRIDDNYNAIEVLNKALSKQGDIDEVYFNLSSNYAIIDNYKMALECIMKCLEIAPDFPNGEKQKEDIIVASQLHYG